VETIKLVAFQGTSIPRRGEAASVNADAFFANFGYLADAPNGLKKLRELILQLAVQGKLVPQDPNDEPASKLLERIRAVAQLVKARKIRKIAPLRVNTDEAPYELPKMWEWCFVGEIAEIIRGVSYKKEVVSDSAKKGYLPLLRAHNINVSVNFDKLVYVPLDVVSEHQLIKKDDILVAMSSGSANLVGKAAQSEKDFNAAFGAFCGLLRLTNSLLSPKFVGMFFQSPYYRETIASFGKGIGINNLQKGQLEKIAIPLPPIPEQHRIVAKVDLLMALCDELEKRQQKKKHKLINLNNAALDRLLSARESDDFVSSWRLIRDNFDFIYTAPETITKLRQAILQLAVQGKLVTQDPKDEPASVLLAKIKAEKERLVKEKKIKKSEPLPLVSPAETPFELPNGWEWVRLDNLCEVITKGSSPKWQGINYSDSQQGILFITSENVGSYNLRLEEPKYVEAKFNEIEPRSILRKNDILMNIVGASIGRTAVYNIDDIANINQAVCLIRLISPDTHVLIAYMLHFFNSPICIYFMFDKQVDNARANLSMGNISKFAIPLPPLAEQHRIVTKVDQLVKLCDELEAKLIKSQTKSEKLVEAAVKAIASN
jgi:type I restriction enzyme S subunit